ncbi:ornithine carbamoyltransferase [Halobacteriales archaeon QS_8_69_26]|nr:MAG: ornithine carbamoyltransferase [Halobacteriales archaeon QS_8_69_26]
MSETEDPTDPGTQPIPDQSPKHVLDVDDLDPDELLAVVERAAYMKAQGGTAASGGPLSGRSLAMLFEKPSTRTRVSFETAMTQLGGHAVFLGPDDTQLGRGEPIRDTARSLSGYVDAITARLYDHDDLAELAEYATVPVVNALTDEAHPCQALADLQTVHEAFGGFDASVAWVGDGNNVARSFVQAAAAVGLDLTVATPEGHGVGQDALDRAGSIGTRPAVTHDPEAAVAGADVVYTDVWVSMGEEDRRAEKVAAFRDAGFQVDAELLGDRALMHCLPANRGEEVTDAAIESDRSLVWDQAENRLHTAKALIAHLVEDG